MGELHGPHGLDEAGQAAWLDRAAAHRGLPARLGPMLDRMATIESGAHRRHARLALRPRTLSLETGDCAWNRPPPGKTSRRNSPEATSPLTALRAAADRLRAEVAKAVVGQDDALDLLLVALFSDGHILLEGVPGTAKTLLVRAFAAAMDLKFGRIQFTPDLMPGDVIGTNLFNFQTNTLPADQGPDLHRGAARPTRSTARRPRPRPRCLQAMQERQVTIDSATHDLGAGFMVIATQNPIEQQGTYPLPEAQLDRFLFKHVIGYPAARRGARDRHPPRHPRRMPKLETFGIQPVFDLGALEQARRAVEQVKVSAEIVAYIVDLIRATREHPSPAVRRLAARGQHAGHGGARLRGAPGPRLRDPRRREASRDPGAAPPRRALARRRDRRPHLRPDHRPDHRRHPGARADIADRPRHRPGGGGAFAGAAAGGAGAAALAARPRLSRRGRPGAGHGLAAGDAAPAARPRLRAAAGALCRRARGRDPRPRPGGGRIPRQIDVTIDHGPTVEMPALLQIPLSGAATVRTEIPLLPTRRGTVPLTMLWLRWTGPYGLVRIQVKQPLDVKLKVVPNIRAVRAAAIALMRQDASFGIKDQRAARRRLRVRRAARVPAGLRPPRDRLEAFGAPPAPGLQGVPQRAQPPDHPGARHRPSDARADRRRAAARPRDQRRPAAELRLA